MPRAAANLEALCGDLLPLIQEDMFANLQQGLTSERAACTL